MYKQMIVDISYRYSYLDWYFCSMYCILA